MSKFLKMDDGPAEPDISKIGSKLRAKQKPVPTPVVRSEIVEQVAKDQGYARTAKVSDRTSTKTETPKPKLGRPSLNEDMVYWKIYLSAEMRQWLEETRGAQKYRRLNDLLEDMRLSFEGNGKKSK